MCSGFGAAIAAGFNFRNCFGFIARESIAGSISGVFSTTLCSPLDVAKTRAQVESVASPGKSSHRYDGPLLSAAAGTRVPARLTNGGAW